MSVQRFVINGRAWAFPTDMEEDKYVANLPLLVRDIQADTARNMVATSLSAHTIASGSGTITLTAPIAYVAGQFIQLVDQAAPETNWVHAQVVADVGAGTSLAFTEIVTSGSGSVSSWTIMPSSPRGPAGTMAAASDGSVGAPGIAFAADPDTGLYRSGDGELAFAANGRLAALLDAGGLVLNGGGVNTGGGNVFMGGGVLRAAREVRDIGGAVQAVGKIAGNYAFSFKRFTGATLEPTADITITAVNWPSGYAEAVLEITGGGDHTITTTSFTDVGEVPTLKTGTGRDILILYSFDGGVTRYLKHGGTV